MISSCFTEKITMTYRTGDKYVDGEFVAGEESEIEIEASVQRLNMRERQLLPDGFRASETLKLYTDFDPIKLIDNDVEPIHDAAEFIYKGKKFVMLASEQWERVIPHWKVTLVKKTKGTQNG